MIRQLQNYSDNVRPLHVAIAHGLANTRAGEQERLALFNRLFTRLPHFQQTLCRIELAECRAAKRGERFAIVA